MRKKNDEATAGLSEWYMEWQLIETALKDGTGVLLVYRMTDVDPGFYVSQGYFGHGCWYALNTAITPAQMNNQHPDLDAPARTTSTEMRVFSTKRLCPL